MAGHLSEKLFVEALKYIPGGVNSPVRAWKAVGENPRFIQRARGSSVVDADGNAFIDFVGSWGPMILGHAHPQVLRAVQDALRDGTSFGAPTAREVEMARELTAAIPSLERVRLVSSGTEATMTALRLARAFTGRRRIVKFDGCYHGHSDALLVRAGSGAMTFGVPTSPGVPAALAGDVIVARYNDTQAVERIFAEMGDEVAALIVEPIAGNMGVVPPVPGFLPALREQTRAHGAVLIVDEVITGFRLRYGCVQEAFGIHADLTCLGKIIGGGLPLAAVGGRADVMRQLAPEGPVYQAGTLAGNPLAVAAGLQTLHELRKPQVYQRLEELSRRLHEGLVRILAEQGRYGCVNRAGSMLTVFFGVETVRDAEGAGACDTAAFARFFRAMLARGVYLPPSAFEALFVSLAHSEDDIDNTLQAAAASLAEA
jgi:glutamate-1-semialdehyde 2,1-aminomutase